MNGFEAATQQPESPLLSREGLDQMRDVAMRCRLGHSSNGLASLIWMTCCAGILLAVGACGPSSSDGATIDDQYFVVADGAYRSGQFAQAAQLYSIAAKRGDAIGQYKLGLLYFWGDGVPKNYLTAMHWLRSSALQGNSEGQYNLAQLYLNGYGVPRDANQAAHWLSLAAKQGHYRAKRNLESLRQLSSLR